LVDKYSSSASAPVAASRLEYLGAHDDHAFMPLKIFERARMRAVEELDQAVAEVDSALETYPKTSLRDQMMLWQGTALQNRDPAGAVARFRALAQVSDDADMRWKALMYTGDIHYQQKNYKTAGTVYRDLIQLDPQKNAPVLIKAQRAGRNRLRPTGELTAYIILLLLTTATVLLPPAGIPWKAVKTAVIPASVYGLSAAVVILWKFDVLAPALPFTLVAVPLLSLVNAAGAAATIKLKARGVSGAVPLAAGLGVTWLLSTGILYVLLFRFHYLFVFEGWIGAWIHMFLK
jgi:tetratricopeptide (TPR) repeat protein